MSDLLQRHLLCSTTGLHDPDPATGRCRDCTTPITTQPVCRTEPVLGRVQPDQEPTR